MLRRDVTDRSVGEETGPHHDLTNPDDEGITDMYR
jgi:hypothetical protein